jgi:hypothetical protein
LHYLGWHTCAWNAQIRPLASDWRRLDTETGSLNKNKYCFFQIPLAKHRPDVA